jgi:2-polyprenyl-3-methyl-5-hydroxy-6-metoxy-1,4-benzoquinol methylase
MKLLRKYRGPRTATSCSIIPPDSASRTAAEQPEGRTELLLVEEFRRRFEAGLLSLDQWDTFSILASEIPLDHAAPHSEQYAAVVMDSWARISGRSEYEPAVDEVFDLDDGDYRSFPYPYSSRDPHAISGYLGAVAHAVSLVGTSPPARVIEFGSGWGHLALTLASSGYDVTAVDLNTASVELLRRRAEALHVPLIVERCGFLDFEASGRFDCVVFFEAFHHCHRPFELLDRCTELLNDGGVLLFVAEAFYDGFYAPWGVRLDGSAAFMTAQEGWLELGFSRPFIESELSARGYVTSWSVLDHLGPYGTFMVARLDRQGRTQ